MEKVDQYLLGQSSVEQTRLQQQASAFANDSNWLFDQIRVAAGSRVVDIGCGPQGCLDLLSRRVGLAGSVVGVEMDRNAVATARRFLADQGINNVEVRQGDGKATGLPRESFDLATARLVLTNIPEPEKVSRR
jgi:ubiquinone/menaquinone biosynthesis C-methylase UbiE